MQSHSKYGRAEKINRTSANRESEGQHRRCCFRKSRTRVDNSKQMPSNRAVERQSEVPSSQSLRNRSKQSADKSMAADKDTGRKKSSVLSKNDSTAFRGCYATRNGRKRSSSFTDACFGSEGGEYRQKSILEANMGEVHALRRYILGGVVERGVKTEGAGKIYKDTRLTKIKGFKLEGKYYVYKKVRKTFFLSKKERNMWYELTMCPMLQRYIAPLYFSCETPEYLHHVTKAYRWDLFYFVRATRDLKRVIDALLQIANALVTLHSYGYVHLDVKPENILIHNSHAVLCDFATCYYLGKKTEAKLGMRLGTIEFCSPEMLKGVATKKSDVYSFTKSVFACIYGEIPELEKLKESDYGDWYAFYAAGLDSCYTQRMSSVKMYQKLYNLSNTLKYE